MANVPQYRPKSPMADAPRVTGQPNAGQAESAIFQGLQRISGWANDRLDDVAKDEGAKAGGLAGLDPKFRPTGDATIRGRAYDAAGLRVAAGRIEVDQTAKADALAQQHKGDPAALSAAFDQAVSQSKTEMGDGLQELWPQVQIGWERLKRAALSNAARENEEAMRDADRATALEQIDARTRRIQQLSYAAGNDKQAEAAVQGELAGLEDLLLQHGPRDGFKFNGRDYAPDTTRGGSLQLDDIQKLLLSAHDTAIEGRVLGKFSLVKGWGAQQKFRDGMMSDYKAGKLPLSMEQVERIGNKMDADIAHSRAVADAAAAGLRETIRDTISTLKNGFPPSLDLKQLNAAVRLSGKPELANDLAQAEQLYAFQSRARTMPPMALDRFLSDERARLTKGGASPFEVSRFELAQNLRDNMVTGLKRDPLAWASQQGGRPLPPLDFRDANSLSASLRARVPYADAIARDYGVAPAYFTDDERTMLGTHLAAAPSSQRLAFLGAITKGVSSDRLPAVIGELAKESPALAQAGMLLATGNTRAAIRINAGLDLLKDRSTIKDATSAKMKSAAQPLLSTLPGGMGGAKGAIMDAATAIYTADQAGKPTTDFDEDAFTRALETAAGATYQGNRKLAGGFDQVQGSTVIVPPGMTGEQMEDLLSRAGDADLAAGAEMGKPPVYGNGKPVDADTIRRAYPVTVGDGKYAFSLTDPADGAPELLSAKTPRGYYVLDLRALKRRNPSSPARKVSDIPAMGAL